jgi:small-conductance mechanosensitive channel
MVPSSPPETPHHPSASPSDKGSEHGAKHEGSSEDKLTVKVRESKVIKLHASLAGVSPEVRAKTATRIIEQLLDRGTPGPGKAKRKSNGDVYVILLGDSPVLELGPDDAAAVGAPSLESYAISIAGKLDEEVKQEISRRDLSKRVVAFCMVVLAGLVAFALVRKLGELLNRARGWLFAEGKQLPSLAIQGIEVVSPAALRGAAGVGFTVARFAGQFGIGYAWLLFTLSLFDTTREFSAKLSGYLISPLTGLVGRIATTLPLLIVLAIAGLVMMLLLRFVGLFFDGIGRGETEMEWVPPDLAAPTSLLIRGGVVLVSLVLGLPFVTGSYEGAVPHVGLAALGALAIAVTPLLASAAVGISVVYGRRVRLGDLVELGGRTGRVKGVSLLDVRLADDVGNDVRIPHLMTLWNPTRVMGQSAPVVVDVAVTVHERHAEVREALFNAARKVGENSSVDLVAIDGPLIRFRVVVRSESREAQSDLLLVMVHELTRIGIVLRSAEARHAPLAESLMFPRRSTVGPTFSLLKHQDPETVLASESEGEVQGTSTGQGGEPEPGAES